MAVVDLPPNSMTSLDLDSWPGFQFQAWTPSCWAGLGFRVVAYHPGMCATIALLGLLCHTGLWVHRCHSWVGILFAYPFLIARSNMKASSQGKTEGRLFRWTFPSRVPFVKLIHWFCFSQLSLSHKDFHTFKAFLEEWNMLSLWIPMSDHPLKSLGIREEKRAAKNILIQITIYKSVNIGEKSGNWIPM